MKANLHNGEDLALLRKFSETGNQAAFRALVERYTGLVYGVALRRTGDAHLSEEIAQNVFLILARKADGLLIQRSLGAWLHGVTMRECYQLLRKEANRQRYLGMIQEQQENGSGGEEENWRAIRPHLDQLLSRLPSRDRDILILHYIEGMKFSEVGHRVGMSSAAAQKRSVRALGKISGYLKRYGVVASTAFLTKGLQAEMAFGAPAGLAGKIGGTSLAATSAATTTGTSATILTTMTTSKFTLTTAALISIVGLPIGYAVQRSTAERGSQSEMVQVAPTAFAPTEVVRPLSEVPNSELVLEWRRLKEEYGTDAEGLRTMHGVIGKMEKNSLQRRALMSTLIAEWAQREPDGVAFFRAKGRAGWERDLFIEEALTADGDLFVSGMMASGSGWQKLARPFLPQIAEHAPERFVELAAEVPAGKNNWDWEMGEAFEVFANEHFERAKAAAEGMSGFKREKALAGVAMAWARMDGTAAFAWAQSLKEGKERGDRGWGGVDGMGQGRPCRSLGAFERDSSTGLRHSLCFARSNS